MKIRIFGTIFVLLTLIGVYILFGEDNSSPHPSSNANTQVDPNAGGLQGLKIQ